MLMRKLRVRNYKCFVDTGDIVLAPRFNIFTGRNDAGRSYYKSKRLAYDRVTAPTAARQRCLPAPPSYRRNRQ